MQAFSGSFRSSASLKGNSMPSISQEDFEEQEWIQEVARQEYTFANKRRLNAPQYKKRPQHLEPSFGHYSKRYNNISMPFIS